MLVVRWKVWKWVHWSKILEPQASQPQSYLLDFFVIWSRVRIKVGILTNTVAHEDVTIMLTTLFTKLSQYWEINPEFLVLNTILIQPKLNRAPLTGNQWETHTWESISLCHGLITEKEDNNRVLSFDLVPWTQKRSLEYESLLYSFCSKNNVSNWVLYGCLENKRQRWGFIVLSLLVVNGLRTT